MLLFEYSIFENSSFPPIFQNNARCATLCFAQFRKLEDAILSFRTFGWQSRPKTPSLRKRLQGEASRSYLPFAPET